MNDKHSGSKNAVYKIWEDEGPDGAHGEHWTRAEARDGSPNEAGDVTKE